MHMQTKARRTMALMLLLLLFLPLLIPGQASAAAYKKGQFSVVTKTHYMKTVGLKDGGTIVPYTSSSLKTRGNTAGASKSEAISADEELRVIDFGKNWAKVMYSNGKKTAFIKLSAITSNNGSHEVATATDYIQFALRYEDALTTEYNAVKGDRLELVAKKGDRVQVMYTSSNGTYRLAWCKKTDYLKKSNTTGFTAKLLQKIATRSGPSTKYDQTAGTFFIETWDSKKVKVLTKVWDSTNEVWWVQVQFTDSGKKYRLYTGAKRVDVDLSLIRTETQLGTGELWVAGEVPGYYGPGTDYARTKWQVPWSQEFTVWGRQNGYILIDFYDEDVGTHRRAWVLEKHAWIKWK